jgi:hypothetical protein
MLSVQFFVGEVFLGEGFGVGSRAEARSVVAEAKAEARDFQASVVLVAKLRN